MEIRTRLSAKDRAVRFIKILEDAKDDDEAEIYGGVTTDGEAAILIKYCGEDFPFTESETSILCETLTSGSSFAAMINEGRLSRTLARLVDAIKSGIQSAKSEKK